MRTINQAGLDLIKASEGCRLTAYLDVAGIPTIGYGHIKGVKLGQVITQAQADQFLTGDLTWAEQAVDNATTAAATSDNQFAAMVSLCFNIGVGNFGSSSVLRFHVRGNTAQAAASFLMWNKAHVDGKLQPVAGLTKRRQNEQALYLTA